jgi:hypothetical protein
LVGLAVAAVLLGVPASVRGAAALADDEPFCAAVRDRPWTSDTLHDWVSFSDQLSVIRVLGERAIGAQGGQGYVGRRVGIRIERTLWRRPDARRASPGLTIDDWGWCETSGGRFPLIPSGVTRLRVGSRYLTPLTFFRGEWTSLDDGRLVLRRGRLEGEVQLGEPTFAHQMLLGLPLLDGAKLVRETKSYRAAVRLASSNPVRRWNAADRDYYRLQGQRGQRRVIVAMGSLPSARWRLHARRRTPRGLCVGIHARPRRRLTPAVTREACGRRPTEASLVTGARSVTARGTFIYGSAAERVARVALTFDAGQRERVLTQPSQAGLRGRERFWIVALRTARRPLTIRAYDRNGQILAERPF